MPGSTSQPIKVIKHFDICYKKCYFSKVNTTQNQCIKKCNIHFK